MGLSRWQKINPASSESLLLLWLQENLRKPRKCYKAPAWQPYSRPYQKNENRPFQCEDCKYCFKSNQDLARHILKDHVPTAKGVTNAPVIIPPPPDMEFKTSLQPVMPSSLPRRGPGGGVSKSSYVCSDYEKGLKGAAALQAFENAPDALQDLTLNSWCKQMPYNNSKISLALSSSL